MTFAKKLFLTLYFINWRNFIAWLPLPLEILDNMCIVIISCQVCDVINLENSLSLLIKPFFYITKSQNQKSKQKCKYLKNEKSFYHEINSSFIILKGFNLSEIVLDARVDLAASFEPCIDVPLSCLVFTISNNPPLVYSLNLCIRYKH